MGVVAILSAGSANLFPIHPQLQEKKQADIVG
jgi:hypothetical protein